MGSKLRPFWWAVGLTMSLVVAGCSETDGDVTDGVIDRRLLPEDIGLGSASIRDVAAHDRVFVAVGLAEDPGEHGGGVWWSEDGEMWARVPHDDALFGERTPLSVAPVEILDVVGTNDGFVAVGGIEEPLLRHDRPLVWLSENGRTWTRAPYDADLESAYIRRVASFNNGLVAVGIDHEFTANPGAVWLSADGNGWEVAFRSPEQFLDVVAAGPADEAVLFAVTDSAVYYSTDATTWARARSLAAPGGIHAVPGVGVVAEDINGQLMASSDGLTWVSLAVPRPHGDQVWVTAAVATDDMSVFFGESYATLEEPTPCGNQRATGSWLWASTDGGETWKALAMPPPPTRSPTAAIVTAERVVLLGGTPSFVVTDQIRSTPSALFDEPSLVAVGQSPSTTSTGC